MAKDDDGLCIGRHTRLSERELLARKLEGVGASAIAALIFNCFLRTERGFVLKRFFLRVCPEPVLAHGRVSSGNGANEKRVFPHRDSEKDNRHIGGFGRGDSARKA